MGDRNRIDEYASRQYGVFNVDQARAAGFDKSAVHRRLDSREWIRLCPGVYCVASAPPKWERQLSAALLSRKQAVATGTSAAYLHGLRGSRAGRPVILVPSKANARSPIATVVRSQFFDRIPTTRIAGFEVTSTEETLLVLARTLPPPAFEATFDEALTDGNLDIGAFEVLLHRERESRLRGIRLLRELVRDRGPDAPSVGSSYLEAKLEMLVSRAPVPPWTREAPFLLNGHPSRVDVFVPAWRLVIEADGRSWHTRKADFETDRSRDNDLAARGIQVLRFTYVMLTDEPADCLATILETGRHRSAIGVV